MFDYEPFKDYPEGRRYTVPKTGGPSWIEQYRVVRSLWRLQLYYTLTNVSARSVSVHHLDAMLTSHPDEALRRIWGHLRPWELDEIDCVHDYLGQVDISLAESEYKVSVQHASLPSLSFEMDTATSATILLDTPSASDETIFLWHQDLELAQYASDGYNSFHSYGLRSLMSPLKESSSKHFRRLGFGIWDLKRMASLELLNAPKEFRPPREGEVKPGPTEVGSHFCLGNICFTWHSAEGNQQIL